MIAPIKITSRAVEEIINILKTKGIPQEYLLRVSIKGGHGCSGVNFTLGFDKKKELDTVSLVSGIKVLIQKSEMMFLIGQEIDFHEGIETRGFVFRNYEDNSTTARGQSPCIGGLYLLTFTQTFLTCGKLLLKSSMI